MSLEKTWELDQQISFSLFSSFFSLSFFFSFSLFLSLFLLLPRWLFCPVTHEFLSCCWLRTRFVTESHYLWKTWNLREKEKEERQVEEEERAREKTSERERRETSWRERERRESGRDWKRIIPELDFSYLTFLNQSSFLFLSFWKTKIGIEREREGHSEREREGERERREQGKSILGWRQDFKCWWERLVLRNEMRQKRKRKKLKERERERKREREKEGGKRKMEESCVRESHFLLLLNSTSFSFGFFFRSGSSSSLSLFLLFLSLPLLYSWKQHSCQNNVKKLLYFLPL